MTKVQTIRNTSKAEFIEIVSKCETKKQIHEHFNVPVSGTYTKIINEKIIQTGATIQLKKPKYETVEKICPICGDTFSTLLNSPKEKITCGYSCSNTFFRSGEDHPNWKREYERSTYRLICFKHHKKKCIICGEDIIVAVHHYDCDHSNNSSSNLVPLCPTHHHYCHSKHYYLIKKQVDNYVKEFTNI